MKICSGHFPMNVAYNDGRITVKNFLGEKTPREIKITPDVQVKIEGDKILIEGTDKEAVGQAAGSIERLCRVTKNRMMT